MEPLAVAALVAIAAAATLAALTGIVAGAIAAAIRGSLVWVGPVAAAGYLAYMYFAESTRVAAAAMIGLPPLVLTLLTCWLVASFLETRRKWRRPWAIAAAAGCALVVGVLDLMLFRVEIRAPSTVALVADAILIALAIRHTSSMRLGVFLLVFLAASVFARDENEVVFAKDSDPDMVAAIKKARETLDEFLAISAKAPANTSGFKLKVMVKEGEDVEHFWVIPFRMVGADFQGVLANEPRVVRNVRGGQLIAFTRAQISDWGYVKDGRQVGSFTVCALFKKMPKEQADYYRRNHGFDC